jgi:predicted RNA binding protein YcfA (HicA-like mRNA interferase family)
MTPKEIIKILESRGLILKRVNGSHHIFYHAGLKKMTVVPLHKKDLPIGTFNAILKQAGIDKKDI